jgi:hypothetical protein
VCAHRASSILATPTLDSIQASAEYIKQINLSVLQRSDPICRQRCEAARRRLAKGEKRLGHGTRHLREMWSAKGKQKTI